MRSKIFCLFLIYLNISAAFGQVITFEKNYDSLGSYYAYNVQQNIDEGYILCGSSYDALYINQASIIRTDSAGNMIWIKTYGSSAVDAAILCTITPDSNILIVGFRESYSSTDGKIWIFKLDQAGNILWSNAIKVLSGRNEPASIDLCNDGGYIIGGSCNTVAHPGMVSFLLKIDSTGNEVWSQTYGNNVPNSGNSVIQTTEGGFLLASTISIGNFSDFYLVKTDSVGDTLWTKTFGNPNVDILVSIKQYTDSNFILVGNTFDANNYDIYLAKLDLSGNLIWKRQFGDSLSNTVSCLQITSDGNYFLVGNDEISGSIYGQILLMKVDTSGMLLWKNDIGGPLTETGKWGIECNDDGFAVVGQVDIAAPPHEAMYFLKVNNNGSLNSIARIEMRNSINLFPIPSHDFLTVQFNYAGEFILSIINLEGKEIKTFNIVNNEQVDISDIPVGLYVACISTRDGKFKMKFVKF